MRPTILLVLAALLFFAPNSVAQDRDDREQETMIDERFSVNEGGTLEVNVGDADVKVVPGASDEVHVEVILVREPWIHVRQGRRGFFGEIVDVFIG